MSITNSLVRNISLLSLLTWQIIFITLDRFCPLSKKKKEKNHPPLFLTDNIKMDRITNPNQMKNTCPFYILFQGLKVLLSYKNCKIQAPDILFFVVFISFYISRYHFSQIFRTSFIQHYLKKRFLSQIFLF